MYHATRLRRADAESPMESPEVPLCPRKNGLECYTAIQKTQSTMNQAALEVILTKR